MLIKDRNFYKNFILLALPIILQNMISLGVNLADNIMLGSFHEAALSGATAVNQIQFIYQNILMGIGDGLVIMASRFWGQKDTKSIRLLSSIAMRFGLVVMLVLFLFVSLFPGLAVGLFTTDRTIIEQGCRYLSVIRFTYPFFCVTTLLLATLRSVEIVNVALIVSVSTLCLNCGINYCLIFGNLGLLRLGVTGAAIGTLIARIVELIIVIIYIKIKKSALALSVRDYLVFDRRLAGDYIRTSAPIILVQSLWGLNTAMQTAILGHLSSAAIAANSMASNLFLMVKTMAVGTASVTNVCIGKTIGEGDLKKVRQTAYTLQIVFVVLGLCSGIILALLTEPVLSLYSFSDESRALARSFLHVLSIVIVFMCYQMPTNSGIIKGGGDTRYVMKLDLISIWGIVIPLSLFAAAVLHASPVIVIICLNLDQIFKCLPAWLKANRGKWIREIRS